MIHNDLNAMPPSPQISVFVQPCKNNHKHKKYYFIFTTVIFNNIIQFEIAYIQVLKRQFNILPFPRLNVSASFWVSLYMYVINLDNMFQF